MQKPLPSILGLIQQTLIRTKYNLAIAAFCMVVITALDLSFHHFVNDNYVFGLSAILKSGYYFLFLIVFAATFMGRFFYVAFLMLIFAVSLFQMINFEYFGSYILPIHLVQVAPDFLLIMSSLFEVLDEMTSTLMMAGIALLLILTVLVPLSRRRVVEPKSLMFILIVISCDFIGNYVFIERNKAKLGEPSFVKLFPDINRLGADNAYRSARYLMIGILPDRLAGKALDNPALPAPQIVSTPDANIILILNETVRAQSLSVLGYEGNTTPALEQIDGLFARTIYAAGTMTRTSVAGLLNRLKHPGLGQQFVSQSNCLFRLAKQNGFATHFVYGYGQNAANTMLPYMCANSIDSIRVRSDAPPGQRNFDASLAYNLGQIDLDQRNFIVIAPRGARSPYADKSPVEFKTFDDEYHNAIFYSHHVVAELIEQISSRSSKTTYILYTADHGELLKGEDTKRGHGWFKSKVFGVPFLFLPVNHPDPDDVMAEAGKVRSHFDLATFAIRLMGYDVAVDNAREKVIYINGSELSGLAGQLKLEFMDDDLRAVDLISGVGSVPTVPEARIDSSG
ncbi:sulfatase-like hydrolase/transferase [Roseovarius aestuarii]|uniref:Phosphoethanolamine transferase EptB n=1 Tax=Roseovarius aestuarii TaxID=475083 RepID=A0A1X7BR20_9RHOB|nr:sulfatase-like hydrolase/transferase [Roseovarius aestuarii]SMC12024.1 Phosphoethanolamine transferase EptB [Roseovarius aestuarii]